MRVNLWRWRKPTKQEAIVLVVLAILVLLLLGSTIIALVSPLITNDYEFLRVPTLTQTLP